MISKQEMEDIWHNKPVGYLQDLVKRKKKEKSYVVKICSISADENPYETLEIKSEGTKWDVEQQAITIYKQMYPDLKHSTWRYNVRKL